MYMYRTYLKRFLRSHSFAFKILLIFCFTLLFSNGQSQSLDDLKKAGVPSSVMEMNLSKAKVDSGDSFEKNSKIFKDTIQQGETNSLKLKDSVVVKLDGENKYMVYGQGLLSEIQPYIASESHLKASENYILGEGDELRVSIWGYSELDALYKINERGSISPKLVGRIYLKGMSLVKAKSFMKRRFATVYDLKNSQIDIDLVHSKTIQVNVIGEVNNPGTYTVASVNSAFNILSLAGGLSPKASVRAIHVIREGELLEVLDIYDYLMDPSSFESTYLKNGDFIVVRPLGIRVGITGAVLRPEYYELKEGEHFEDLIKLAGGFLSDAFLEAIHIESIDGNKRLLKDYNFIELRKNKLKIDLKNGDEVNISNIESKIYGLVELQGAVNIPGNYALVEGLRLRGLIEKGKGLTFEAYMDRAFIIRTNKDGSKSYIPFNVKDLLENPQSEYNQELKEFDKVVIYENEQFVDNYYVEIFGAVRKKVKVDYNKGMTLKNLIALAGGLKAQAANSNIEISRISNFSKAALGDEPTVINTIRVSVDNDLKLNVNEGFKLQPFDQVFVRQTPNFEFQRNVRIDGEVKYPGLYALHSKDERLKDLIIRAGGLTEWASLEQSRILRDSLKSPLLLDLNALYKGRAKEYNYVLEDGDYIEIPRVVNTVSVKGAVEYPFKEGVYEINVPFKKRKKVKYYINEYVGGFKKKALRRKVYVQAPGGKIKKTSHFMFIKKYPKVLQGDLIVVPFKIEKEDQSGEREKVDWNEVIENFTIKITGILTVSLLIKNLAAGN